MSIFSFLFGSLFPIIIIGIAVFITGVYTVEQQTAAIIERLGKFHKVAYAGLHVKMPIIDKIVYRSNLRTLDNSFEIDAKTKDNVTVGINVSTQFYVDNREKTTDLNGGICKSYYTLSNPKAQMKAFLSDALRSSIPQYTLDEVFEKKEDIANDVNNIVTSKMESYGFVIVQTLITGIALPHEVEASMNKINAAQREKVAAQDLAEADKIRRVTEAQAESEAAQKAGEGIANQRTAIAKGIKDSLDTIKDSGVSSEEANFLFMYTQWVEMMNKFAESGRSTTVVLPNDFEQSCSMFSQMLTANKIREDLPEELHPETKKLYSAMLKDELDEVVEENKLS